MGFGFTKQIGNRQLIADNLSTFEQYNIGDKVSISYSLDEVYYGIISSFGYDTEGAMVINVDMVGQREIRPYNPRNSYFNVKVIK
jgi:hypothetical protein